MQQPLVVVDPATLVVADPATLVVAFVIAPRRAGLLSRVATVKATVKK
jgi:hypothetical protein